jgi:uncharacterized protein (UPF0332 family)
MKQFKAYIAKGLLKTQTPNFEQINRQLQRAARDLGTAKHLLAEDPQWAATIAYQSMLRAGRALLFANGVLPADGRQHKTVVELTGDILGAHYEVLVQQFERLRRKRNVFFYDSEESITGTETQTALETARELLTAIEKKIAHADPQKSLQC